MKFVSTRVAQILVDVGVCVASVVIAYLIRFEGAIPQQSYKQMVLLAPYLAIAHLVVNAFFGLYRIVWRYVGLREAIRFGKAVAVVSAVLLAFRLFWPTNNAYFKVPIGIILVEGILTFLGLTGARFLRRIVHERSQRVVYASPNKGETPTLFVGAGEAGLAMAREAAARPDLGLRVVGFIDDDPAKRGMEIHGRRVLGTLSSLPTVLRATGARQVIITSAAIPPAAILKIMDYCRPSIDVRIVPGLYQVLGSRLNLTMLREVRIGDLLRREPVPPSMSLEDLNEHYAGKRVLVTGAGGSIGSELCRQLALLEPAELILVERDENNLFQIEHELRSHGVRCLCTPVLADAANRDLVDEIFRQHRPHVVCHAAAYKHVGMMERFPAFAVHNNVLATKNLVGMANRHGVENFVMISTDKAVNPTSVMGATKRIAELIVQHAAGKSSCRFSCVRFGNVLGSRGSVVGIFTEQIKRGGPVTVTHEEATRYFMTIPEAVNLVLQAATLGDRGEVFLLDMGEPVKIIDLARQMIRLSGLTEEEVPIEVVGLRKGEKLSEVLRMDTEDISPTKLRKIRQCAPCELDHGALDRTLQRIEALALARDHAAVREALRELDIGYGPSANEPDSGAESAPAPAVRPVATQPH